MSMRGGASLRALSGLLTILALAFVVAWYGFLEPPFLSYRNEPFPVEPPEVRAGDTVGLQVVRCSSASEEEDYLIARRLVRLDPAPGDVIKTILPGGGLVPISPGCSDELSKASAIPADTPPGLYFIQGHAKVEGRWRTSKVPWSSQKFRVLPAEAQPAPAAP